MDQKWIAGQQGAASTTLWQANIYLKAYKMEQNWLNIVAIFSEAMEVKIGENTHKAIAQLKGTRIVDISTRSVQDSTRI